MKILVIALLLGCATTKSFEADAALPASLTNIKTVLVTEEDPNGLYACSVEEEKLQCVSFTKHVLPRCRQQKGTTDL